MEHDFKVGDVVKYIRTIDDYCYPNWISQNSRELEITEIGCCGELSINDFTLDAEEHVNFKKIVDVCEHCGK